MEKSNNHFLVRAMDYDTHYVFAIDEYDDEDGPKSVREAFQKRKDFLLQEIADIDNLLLSHKPERAQSTMVENVDFKIWELVVKAPDQQQIKPDFNRISDMLLNKQKDESREP